MVRGKGVLLIHGLRGSPREYILVESALQAEGYRTRAIALPGHGQSPKKGFTETSAEEILDYCMAEYETLAAEVDSVHVVGHSLGGICTLLTAARQPAKLKSIVTLSAPYEHAYFLNYHRGLASLPLSHLIKGIAYAPECRTGFEKPEYRMKMYPQLMREAQYMLSRLQEDISRIHVPVCMAHSVYDLAIPYAEMDKLASGLINAPHISTHTLSKCGHMIFPNSRERQQATRLIVNFLKTEFADFRRHAQQNQIYSG